MNELSSSNLNTIQSLGFELVHALERPSVLGQVAIIAIAIAIASFLSRWLKPWLKKHDPMTKPGPLKL